MTQIRSIAELATLYRQPEAPAIRKVAGQLTPLYRKWIMTSRLCILATIGPEGTDASPRGDDGPVVAELDPQTVAMPDWRGNNRLDSLRNIVRDGRVSLLFLVPGSNNVIRLNGTAIVSSDSALRQKFTRKDRLPTTVIVISIIEIYTQCARALLRAGVWSRDDSEDLPTIGEILAEQTNGEEGGSSYDQGWAARAKQTMW